MRIMKNVILTLSFVMGVSIHSSSDTLAIMFMDGAEYAASLTGNASFSGVNSTDDPDPLAHCKLSGHVSGNAELLNGSVDIPSNVVDGDINMNGGNLCTTAAADLPRVVMSQDGSITIGGDCSVSATGPGTLTINSVSPTTENDGYKTTLGSTEGPLQVPCFYTDKVFDDEGNLLSYKLHPRYAIVTADTDLRPDVDYVACVLQIDGVRAQDVKEKRAGGVMHVRQIEATTCDVPANTFTSIRASSLKLGSVKWNQYITAWEGAVGFDLTEVLLLRSSAFVDGFSIPAEYTCAHPNGIGISPPLTWKNAPTSTASFTLIMDDPDGVGGTVDHWLLFNIPSTVTQLEQDIQTLPTGTLRGINVSGGYNYVGPCPPDHKEHRYLFKLYALDILLSLAEGATKQDIETAMQGHILEDTQLMGRYDHVT